MKSPGWLSVGSGRIKKYLCSQSASMISGMVVVVVQHFLNKIYDTVTVWQCDTITRKATHVSPKIITSRGLCYIYDVRPSYRTLPSRKAVFIWRCSLNFKVWEVGTLDTGHIVCPILNISSVLAYFCRGEHNYSLFIMRCRKYLKKVIMWCDVFNMFLQGVYGC